MHTHTHTEDRKDRHTHRHHQHQHRRFLVVSPSQLRHVPTASRQASRRPPRSQRTVGERRGLRGFDRYTQTTRDTDTSIARRPLYTETPKNDRQTRTHRQVIIMARRPPSRSPNAGTQTETDTKATNDHKDQKAENQRQRPPRHHPIDCKPPLPPEPRPIGPPSN